MGNAGGQLAERSHLLGLDQAGLGCLQVTIRRLRGVAGGVNLLFGSLAFGDVAVDQHETATWHRVAPHLDDLSIRARALNAQVSGGVLDSLAQLRFEVGRAVLAPCGEVAEIINIARPLRYKSVRQV